MISKTYRWSSALYLTLNRLYTYILTPITHYIYNQSQVQLIKLKALSVCLHALTYRRSKFMNKLFTLELKPGLNT